MWIPYGTTHYNTATGRARKRVRCEWCNTNFQYDLEREVTGHAKNLLFLDNQGAQERAADRAEAKLEREIERAVDPVPCQKCARYQSNMFQIAREQYHLGLYYAGYGFLLLAFLFVVTAANLRQDRDLESAPLWTKIAIGVSSALAATAYVSRRLLISQMNPNDEPEEDRLAIAAERCIPFSQNVWDNEEGSAWES